MGIFNRGKYNPKQHSYRDWRQDESAYWLSCYRWKKAHKDVGLFRLLVFTVVFEIVEKVTIWFDNHDVALVAKAFFIRF